MVSSGHCGVSCGCKNKPKSISSTFFGAAAGLRTTRAADVAAALLRAALAAADAEQHDQQESADDDEQDSQPVWSGYEGTPLLIIHVFHSAQQHIFFRRA